MQMITEYSELQMKQIGERIKFARRARGLNQGQLCDRAEISSIKIMGAFESGKEVPRGERLKLIAKALGVTENYILEGNDMSMSSVAVVKSEPRKVEIAERSFVELEPINVTTEKILEAIDEPRKISNYIWANGEKLNALRKEHGVTNKDIADICDVSAQTVIDWKAGRSRISSSNVKLLSDFFNVPFMDLVDEKRTETDKPEYSAPGKKEIVTVEVPKTTIDITRLPENPERVFCENIKYYISERGLDETKFLRENGGEEGFLDLVAKSKSGMKLPLSFMIKICAALGKTVEEVVMDDISIKIRNEIEEYEKRIAELKSKISG